MTRKSLASAPRSTLRWWGLQSAPAFDHAVDVLNGFGCVGPTSWKEGALVSFTKELSPTLKASIGLSTFSADNGYAAFDCSVVLFSSSLFARSAPADPWMGGSARPVFEGFTPCLTIHLSHLKWCEREDETNPSWAMTLGGDTTRANIHVWAADFSRLILPLLAGLRSDDGLETLLERALRRATPRWVKSDPPYFVWLPQRLERLRSK